MEKERRQHKLYLTKNREYHFRNEECVGVRDRRTGKWVVRHRALRGRLIGFRDRVNKSFKIPFKGGRLHMVSRSMHVLTSPLEVIIRPRKQDPDWYVNNCKSGEITVASTG